MHIIPLRNVRSQLPHKHLSLKMQNVELFSMYWKLSLQKVENSVIDFDVRLSSINSSRSKILDRIIWFEGTSKVPIF